MRNLYILGIVASTFFVSCQGANGDKATTTTQQEVAENKGEKYTLDAEKSLLKWTGYHKGGINPRFGTLNAKGTISIENEVVTGGIFNIDMNSVLTDDRSVDVATTGGKTAADMDAHLKNSDFFDTEKYPTAKFEITNVGSFDSSKEKSRLPNATNTISGNLTIKDKTVNVTFPVKITVTGSEVAVESKFTINRQDWGLTYGTEGDAKDWMISKEVDIELNIIARK